ncbi:hypothetical protein TRICHSKD4_6269 [Roseibium sp. TrichSKD4]|uniref:SctD/MshK family protein n=1 Tax=Roseibium sp. TrichSKD4 TaxID=744980 RepID=UPI0001E5737B|nr:hypothetical protein [Roseibium sp. TrichSKD4]EFO28564.1 hypothetical protein TRICHSKD4_6269 [Roseibium sp. TrichSKD4]
MTQTSVQGSAVSDRLDGFPSRAVQYVRDLFGLKVRIVGGYHEGVSKTSNQLSFTIGSDGNDDFCLFAETIEPSHLKIERNHALAGSARITAQNGPVILENGSRLEAGTFAEVDLPTTVRANGTTIEFEKTGNVLEIVRNFILVLLIFVGSWLAADLLRVTFDKSVLQPANAAVDALTEKVDAALPGLTGQKPTQQHAELLQTRIRDAGLAHRIVVTEGRDNVLVASGSIPDAEAASWRTILKWFDELGSPMRLVNNVVKTKKDASVPAIASVWFENGKAQVLLSDGNVVGVGDTYGGGWKVEAITREGIEISRGGKNVKLTF